MDSLPPHLNLVLAHDPDLFKHTTATSYRSRPRPDYAHDPDLITLTVRPKLIFARNLILVAAQELRSLTQDLNPPLISTKWQISVYRRPSGV